MRPPPLVAVLPDCFGKAWPNADAQAARLMPLDEALATDFATDAHVQLITAEHRLSKEACEVLEGGAPMVAFALDVDTPRHVPADEAWWGELVQRAEVLAELAPGPTVYRTRGGARLVWELAEPVAIRSHAERLAWRDRYLRSALAVYRACGIEADPACADFTRLYRLPHATRDGGASPERLEVLQFPAPEGPGRGVWPWHAGADESADLELARLLGGPWERVAKRWERATADARRPLQHPNSAPATPPTSRAEAYARAAFEGATREIDTAAKGDRNTTVNAEAFAIGRLVGGGVVGRSEALAQLVAATDRLATNADERAEFRATAERALGEGEQHPRTMQDRIGWQTMTSTHTNSGSSSTEPPGQHAVVRAWKPLGELGDVFGTKPPKRRWLLKRDGDGVLPLGKVGIFAAAGGVGKTMACVQLALAVATGRRWLAGAGERGVGGFEVPAEGTGHVLLALGEEDVEEVHRRVYHSALAMGLSDVERQFALERIIVLPLAGQHVSLTHAADEHTDSPETAAATELREKMRASGIDWRLVVFDPLSRFAGPDAEKDNAAATRFIETAETFCKLAGGPTVLVVHHSAQHARGDVAKGGRDRDASQVARGATGITDGARWVASLEARHSDAGEELEHLAELHVVKNNYAKPMRRPVILRRNREHGGALHELDAADLATVTESPKARIGDNGGNVPTGRRDLA